MVVRVPGDGLASIRGVFPHLAQRSWDKLRLHCHPDQHLVKVRIKKYISSLVGQEEPLKESDFVLPDGKGFQVQTFLQATFPSLSCNDFRTNTRRTPFFKQGEKSGSAAYTCDSEIHTSPRKSFCWDQAVCFPTPHNSIMYAIIQLPCGYLETSNVWELNFLSGTAGGRTCRRSRHSTLQQSNYARMKEMLHRAINLNYQLQTWQKWEGKRAWFRGTLSILWQGF